MSYCFQGTTEYDDHYKWFSNNTASQVDERPSKGTPSIMFGLSKTGWRPVVLHLGVDLIQIVAYYNLMRKNTLAQ